MSKRCAYMNIGLPLVMIVLGLVLALIGPNFIHVRGRAAINASAAP